MSDGRYVYETKRPLQLCWLATSGTQEGRIAHHLCIAAAMPPFRTSWLYLVPPFTLQRYELFLKVPNYLA